MSDLPLGRVAGATSTGQLGIPHGQHQSQIVLLASHQDGTKKGRRCSYCTSAYDDIWALSRGFSQDGLPHQFSGGHSGYLTEIT